MSFWEFCVSDISSRSFILGRAFHCPHKPPFSWFARVIAWAHAITPLPPPLSCQGLPNNRPKFLKSPFNKTLTLWPFKQNCDCCIFLMVPKKGSKTFLMLSHVSAASYIANNLLYADVVMPGVMMEKWNFVEVPPLSPLNTIGTGSSILST